MIAQTGQGGIQFLPGSSTSKEPFDIPVERFLSMLKFEDRGILDDLGLEINTETLKFGDQRFESFF
jgi:MinD-like ATPase involved in chromosome partitioning or flagellar assembly